MQVFRSEKEFPMRGQKRWAAIILAILCSTFVMKEISLAQDEPSRVAFCDLIKSNQKYDNKVVATQAFIQSSGHEVHLRSPECPSTATNDQSASLELPSGWYSTKLGKRLSKILRHDRTGKLGFEAVFQSSDGPYGPERTRFHFVLRRLISVEELSNRDPQAK
jgi:hypothetical protein